MCPITGASPSSLTSCGDRGFLKALSSFRLNRKPENGEGSPTQSQQPVKTSTLASRVSMLSARIELVVLFLDGSAMLAAWKPKYASASFRLTQ